MTAVDMLMLRPEPVWIWQERKTAAHVQKLEAARDKQQAVLRRKTEEAEAARKRLKACTPALPTAPPHPTISVILQPGALFVL